MLEHLKLGILGGGQLGAMLIRHAIDFGVRVAVMDKDPNAPGARYTSRFRCDDPGNYHAVLSFGKDLDVLTIEKEAVNIAALQELSRQGVKVFPSPDTIEIIQDKYQQKRFLEGAGIPVAKGMVVESREELQQHIERLPACLKKRRNGYDGKGVMILKDAADIDYAFDEPCVLEELVEISQEISVIVARNEAGEVKCYDPVVMNFDEERFILDYQSSPAPITKTQTDEAIRLAMNIAAAIDLVGILAVEMFITNDGRLLVNELAPRPHNSGHHTIEACKTSQYEQLLRVVLGLPLGETGVRTSSVMVNILEPPADRAQHMPGTLRELLAMSNVHLHWYGKQNSREGRKIGHVTITDSSMEQVIFTAEKVRNLLNN